MDESFNEATLTAALTTRWLGHLAYFFPTIGSTNDWLKAQVAAGDEQTPPAGALAVADYQSQGKGRLNRRWEARPGTSLLFSVLFRPHWPAVRANWLTMMASLAAAEAIEQVTGLVVGLKWPNDVIMASRNSVFGKNRVSNIRKVGGLLLEGEFEGDYLQTAVLGIGLNVNLRPEELPPVIFPATSLLAELGRPVSRLALLVALLQRLEEWYEVAEAGRSPQPAWDERLVTKGRPVQVSGAITLEGMAEGTDEWGHLWVRDAAGVLHVVTAGDVTLRE